jgi:hypothetical protein
MSSTTHISPTQDTGGNVNYLPNSCNISDISMISVYWSDIMNKPGFCNVSITGSYNDLLNVPSLSTVAFSGDYNSLSNRPWINSDSNIYNNNQGNVGIGTNNPTEKLHLVGNFSISGDIIPAINSNFNLGSSNYKWKDLYLSGNSIYLDNLIISKNSSNNIEIRDSDNNLKSISLNQLELNDGDNKLRFLYSNGALVFNSNGVDIQGIEFSNYPKIIYSNNLYTTSNTIIDYTNYRINNLNFNTGDGGNGTTINISTDTIQIGTSNKFITSNTYESDITFMSNLNVYGFVGIGTNNPLSKLDVNGDINFTGALQLNQRPLPFSVYSNTNILSSNGLFSYIPTNVFSGYYTFLTNGTITFPQTTSCDIIVVGAGGNGGQNIYSGGGGAGEVIAYESYSFTTGTYNIKIGNSSDGSSSNLRDSKITSNNIDLVTAKGGGDGAYNITINNIFGLLDISLSGTGTALTSNVIGNSSNYYVSFISGTSTLNLNKSLNVDILLVGGGGGGRNTHGPGGGAGAVIYLTNQTLNPGIYTIKIGEGGKIAGYALANSGEDTEISLSGTVIYRAKGGGGGGQNGGSGGGSGTAVSTNIPSGTYGNNGGGYTGTASPAFYAGASGGGAGAVGGSVNNTARTIAAAGIGIQVNITGSNIYYGGGGGGGSTEGAFGAGGLGGGGRGGFNTTSGAAGIPNTGGGGGGGAGGYPGTGDNGGAGGSGIVILRFKDNINTNAITGGSGGGGLSSIYSNLPNLSNAAVAGTKWNNTYSFVTNGFNGTLTSGGNGGSALSNIGYTETITSNSFVLGVGGLGATSNSVPSLKTTYGSGGDGNGGLGTQGIVIIKVPLNIQRPRFDGYINYSNIDNRPVLNELLSTNNYLNIGYYNQVNFPLGDVSWNNEWFLYIGRSPTSIQNSFIFWHLTSNINSKWWFNGTQTSTNNEISDARIKKEITEIQNPLDKLMLIKPKEYYLCDEKDCLRKYGVIAQDVASNQELSHLVYKDDDFIANVYTTATYISSPKFLLITTTSIIGKVAVDDELKLLLDNMNIENIEIIIEETPYHNRYKKRYVKVKKIIDEFTIEIYEEIELSENEKSNILIYGKRVNDFNKLDYSSLYSLNIACTQELYKIIQEQKNKIDELEQRIIQLENR